MKYMNITKILKFNESKEAIHFSHFMNIPKL